MCRTLNINTLINKIDNLDDEGLSKTAEYYSTAQPVLFAYAGKAAIEYKNEKLEGFLVYYFCVIAEAFQNEGLTPKSIDDQMIEISDVLSPQSGGHILPLVVFRPALHILKPFVKDLAQFPHIFDGIIDHE